MLDRFNKIKKQLLENEFSRLNAEQRQAVFAPYGNSALILRAGAGTGKTTTVVNKIAYLIKYGDAYTDSERVPDGVDENVLSLMEAPGGVASDFVKYIANNPIPPYRLLAVTFTNKAANEMKERICQMVGSGAEDIWVGTFHSICIKILHRYIDRLDGFNGNFTIYDTDDSKSLIKSCVKQLDLNEKEFTPAYLLNIISGCKNTMMTPEEFENEAAANYKQMKIAEVYSLYQQRLKEMNALDFDDIINHTVTILKDNPDVAEKLSGRFKQVIVDEFQDTNDAQYEFVDIISQDCRNLCAVGDDDQSIYGWRGANIDHIMNLSKTARCLTINRNYRSRESIIAVANSIIKNNTYRFAKELRATLPGGEKVTYNRCESDFAEGYYVADTIERLAREDNRKYSDFTVLYRTNAQSRIFEECLMRLGIPYKIVGSLRFYERQEIKDMLAYMRVLLNPSDVISLRRIINLPKRGIGQTTVDMIENLSVQTGKSCFDIIKNCENYESIKRARNGLTDFAKLIQSFLSFAAENPVSELIKYIAENADLKSEYIKEGEDICASRLENIGELMNMAAELEAQNGDEPYTLNDFLERIALVSGIDEMEDDAGVTLMTAHTSKGLEFPVVFIVGLEETLFPSIRGYVEDEKEIEEERRLCYVAVTRAKEKLFLTCAGRRMTYGKTSYNPISRFIKEIPENLLNDISEPINDAFDSDIEKLERASGVSFSKFAASYSENPSKPDFSKAQSLKTFVQRENNGGITFNKGDRVSHKKFGDGTVNSVTVSGDMTVLSVDFDKFGRKNIISSVVTKL